MLCVLGEGLDALDSGDNGGANRLISMQYYSFLWEAKEQYMQSSFQRVTINATNNVDVRRDVCVKRERSSQYGA